MSTNLSLTTDLSIARASLAEALSLAAAEQVRRDGLLEDALTGADIAALRLAEIRRDQSVGLTRAITRAVAAAGALL